LKPFNEAEFAEPRHGRYEIGDIVTIRGFTDGYVIGKEYVPEMGSYVYFVETTHHSEWFRAGELELAHRVVEEKRF